MASGRRYRVDGQDTVCIAVHGRHVCAVVRLARQRYSELYGRYVDGWLCINLYVRHRSATIATRLSDEQQERDTVSVQ